jgi:hypothetical protein
MAAESRIELWQAAGDYLRGLLAFDDLYVLAIRLAPALIGDAVACELAGKIVFAKVDGLDGVRETVGRSALTEFVDACDEIHPYGCECPRSGHPGSMPADGIHIVYGVSGAFDGTIPRTSEAE